MIASLTNTGAVLVPLLVLLALTIFFASRWRGIEDRGQDDPQVELPPDWDWPRRESARIGNTTCED